MGGINKYQNFNASIFQKEHACKTKKSKIAFIRLQKIYNFFSILDVMQ